MSWLSQFADDPIEYAQDNPWKAAALIGAPLAAFAAPFALPALGGAMGIGGAAAAGAEGAGLAGLFGGAEALGGGAGFLGADAGALGAGAFGAEAGGLGGGLTASGAAGGGAEALLSSLGLDSSAFGADALSAFGSATEGGLGAGASGGADLGTIASQGFAPLDTSGQALEGVSAADPGFWDKLLSGGTKSITNNPLGIGLAAGGLGLNIMQGQNISPEQEMLKNNAASLNAQGQQLMSYMQSGTLPPGLKMAVDNATKTMRARIVANHAKNGQSTNPAQNSALTEELNQVDRNAVALIAQKGQELLQSGMNATNMSNQLYAQLEAMNQQRSQRMGQAIANFAAALSGPRPVQINTGGVQRAA